MALVFKTPITTLNTTTKDIQNINGHCPPCPDCPEVKLDSVEANYTENGEYSITPKQGFDGISNVDITVNVPSDVNNQNKEITVSSNGSQTISADAGYTGLGSIALTVDVDTTTPYNEGYAAGETAGIVTGKVQGAAEQKAKLTSTTITENGTTTREDGWNSVTVDVDVVTPYNNGVAAGEAAQKAKLESATFVSNGTYTKEDGYNSVTVNVPSDINNQEKTADPTTSSQEITADAGYSGLSKVTVSAVTSSIDSNITASNIKKDVTILGVTGTFDPQPELQAKTATPATSQQVIEPDAGKDGLSSVTISGVTSAIDANIQASNIKSGVTILGVQGTVNEGITPTGNINITDTNSTNVTNYATAQVVDANLSASNIKKDVSILGVVGTYEETPDLETKTVTYTTNDTYTITPTTGKDGMSEVTVTVNVAGGGSGCPLDWASAGWSCTDVANSIGADLAYTAQKKAEYENNTITNFATTKAPGLRIAPKVSILPQNMNSFFYNSSIAYVPMLDTSQVTEMPYAFASSKITTIPLYDTSNVTNLSDCFLNCDALISIPAIDTSSVSGAYDMTSVFSGCTALTTVPQLNAAT